MIWIIFAIIITVLMVIGFIYIAYSDGKDINDYYNGIKAEERAKLQHREKTAGFNSD